MKEERFQELVEKYLEGAINSAEASELADALDGSEDLRRRMADEVTMAAGLMRCTSPRRIDLTASVVSALRDAAGKEAMIQKVMQGLPVLSRRRSLVLRWTGGVAVLALLGLMVYRFMPVATVPASSMVQPVSGDLTISDTRVASGKGQSGVVQLSDRSTIHVDSDTEIHFASPRDSKIMLVYLDHGSASFDLKGTARQYVLKTRVGDIEPFEAGKPIAIDLGYQGGPPSDPAVTVMVTSGPVRVRNPHGVVYLSAGETRVLTSEAKVDAKLWEGAFVRLLQRWDRDRDGRVSGAECSTHPGRAVLFDRFDLNSDGAITRAEWIEGNRQPPKEDPLVAMLPRLGGPLQTMAFSPNGKVFAVATKRSTAVRWWNVGDWSERAPLATDGYTSSIVFLHDQLAAGGGGTTVRFWKAESGEQAGALNRGRGGLNGMAFHPSGNFLAVAGRTSVVEFWDTVEGKIVRTFSGNQKRVHAVAISPDGTELVSAGWDTSIKIWNMDSGEEVRTLAGHRAPVATIVISPDGRVLASGAEDSVIKLWDMETGREIRTLAGHRGPINGMVFSPDGKYLVSAGGDLVEIDPAARMWNVETGEVVRTFGGHPSSVFAVAISPDGKLLATGSDSVVKVWRLGL